MPCINARAIKSSETKPHGSFTSFLPSLRVTFTNSAQFGALASDRGKQPVGKRYGTQMNDSLVSSRQRPLTWGSQTVLPLHQQRVWSINAGQRSSNERHGAPLSSKSWVSGERQPSARQALVCAASSVAGTSSQPLNVAFVSAEVAPWSKTGGLGDVVGGLPIELARRGHNVVSIAPRYDQHWDAWDTSITASIDGEEVRYFHTIKDGVGRIWVDHPWFLSKVWGKTGSKLYGSKSGSDYADNQKRFLLFNKAAVKALEVLPFSPGTESIIVANDWHTAILPVLVKEIYQKNGQFHSLKTALCIHNIAFQGRFWDEDWKVLGLPNRVKALFEFEDGYARIYSETEPEEGLAAAPGQTFKKLNWLKAGILAADKLLTVSPNYATEIAEDDEKGVELAHIIREAGGLEGIVNGCDVGEWSPFLDKHLDVKYDAATLDEGKAVAKETLQAELGLAVDPKIPVFGFIGRLEEQKGVDILIDALPSVAREGGIQVVVLGTGKKSFEAAVLELDKTFPDTVKGVVKFNVPLAHLIIAGADFMLVPSRFEPCGLIQLHAMNYGTVPIVSSTGGLVDTVKDSVTGFHAGCFNPDKLDKKDSNSLASTVKRATAAFHTPEFQTMRERCIVQELSWERPAKKWESVLRELWAAPHKATTQPPRFENRQAQAQRSAAHLTPVQEINQKGDTVPQDAVARKAAATQSIIEQNKPKGMTSPGPAREKPQTASAAPAYKAPTETAGRASSENGSPHIEAPTKQNGATGSSVSQSGPLKAAASKISSTPSKQGTKGENLVKPTQATTSKASKVAQRANGVSSKKPAKHSATVKAGRKPANDS